jgi:hypothetical protein
MTTIEQKIIEFVNKNPGVSGVGVIAKLPHIFGIDNMWNDFDLDDLYQLVEKGELVEVEYTLPDSFRTKSLFFPKNTKVNIVEHS